MRNRIQRCHATDAIQTRMRMTPPRLAHVPCVGIRPITPHHNTTQVCEMMPSRLNRGYAAFVSSKVNAIFWFCFASAFASALVGILVPSRQKVFEVTEKRGFSTDAELTRQPLSPCGMAGAAEASALLLTTEAPLNEVCSGDGSPVGSPVGSPARLGGGGDSSHSDREDWDGDAHVGGDRGGPWESMEGSQRGRESELSDGGELSGAATCAESYLSGGGGKSCRVGLVASATVPAAAAAAAAASGGGCGDAPSPSPRDSTKVDIVFHQLVLSAEMLMLVAGLLRRTLGQHHHHFYEHAWQRLGLILVPAAWMISNMLPMLLVMAYTYMPARHTLHSGAIGAAFRAHSWMLVFVAFAMLHAAHFHPNALAHSTAHVGHGTLAGASAHLDQVSRHSTHSYAHHHEPHLTAAAGTIGVGEDAH